MFETSTDNIISCEEVLAYYVTGNKEVFLKP